MKKIFRARCFFSKQFCRNCLAVFFWLRMQFFSLLKDVDIKLILEPKNRFEQHPFLKIKHNVMKVYVSFNMERFLHIPLSQTKLTFMLSAISNLDFIS